MQNVLRKIEKSSKFREEQKTLIPVFAYFLSNGAKIFSAGETGYGKSVSPDSFDIVLFSKNLSFKLLATREATIT